MWLFLAFAAVNLLILMEVADRLSLKGDLEIARDIQLAMLPGGLRQAGDAVVCGVTRPANTVGGDFYDILPLARRPARPRGRRRRRQRQSRPRCSWRCCSRCCARSSTKASTRRGCSSG